jgi:hypothetical protein
MRVVKGYTSFLYRTFWAVVDNKPLHGREVPVFVGHVTGEKNRDLFVKGRKEDQCSHFIHSCSWNIALTCIIIIIRLFAATPHTFPRGLVAKF